MHCMKMKKNPFPHTITFPTNFLTIRTLFHPTYFIKNKLIFIVRWLKLILSDFLFFNFN